MADGKVSWDEKIRAYLAYIILGVSIVAITILAIFTIYADIEELQKDLDEWLDSYNNERTHQGKMCCGRTPIETLEDGKSLWEEKLVADGSKR